MFPYQRRILSEFRNLKTHIVFNVDQNLTPCIIEQEQYTKGVLKDE